MNRKVSLVILVSIAVGVGVLFFRVMAHFLLPLFLAVLLVIMFRPLHRWILAKLGGHTRIASAISTLAIAVIVFLPSTLLIRFAIREGMGVITSFDTEKAEEKLALLRDELDLKWQVDPNDLHYVQRLLDRLWESTSSAGPAEFHTSAETSLLARTNEMREELKKNDDPEAAKTLEPLLNTLHLLSKLKPDDVRYRDELEDARYEFVQFKHQLSGSAFRSWMRDLANPSDEDLTRLRTRGLEWGRNQLAKLSGPVAGFAGRLILGLVIVLVSLYFFLADGPGMVAAVMRLSPLDEQYENRLVTEFETISRAVVLATVLAAIAQGCLAGIGFYFAGVSSVVLLSLLTILFAMIPFVGAAAVWMPVALWLFFYDGNYVPAIILAIYGACVISTIDNVIKPLVLHGQSNLHPLLALLSVLGGVQVLGPAGIFVGPMLVTFLHAILVMLQNELTIMSSTAPGTPATAVGLVAAAEAAEEVSPVPSTTNASDIDKALMGASAVQANENHGNSATKQPASKQDAVKQAAAKQPANSPAVAKPTSPKSLLPKSGKHKGKRK